ncbi:PREDICTED: aquaporin NIP1-1-like [Ipomoea nil]|uniref:aquaporin NIP1-1-like n=1 Tax=Ipomoea nil TaxID=35883 RepID=UPI000900D1CD|nr:PREDICTED: aquaporin NIP1-1-like [Ipomoea nil]
MAAEISSVANGNRNATTLDIRDDDVLCRPRNFLPCTCSDMAFKKYAEAAAVSSSAAGYSDFMRFMQKLIAEFMGTYLLLFAGFAALLTNKDLSLPVTAMLWGMDVMIMLYTVGHLSGAHFNPAVTLAFASCKRFPWRHVPAYIIAQVLAATLATGTVRLMFSAEEDHFLGTVPAGSDMQSLILEFLITFYLMFAVSGVATDKRGVSEFTGLSVGAVIAINSIIAGPISGASMNPARTLGPAIISNRYKSIWVYMLGPTAGATAGVWFYNAVRLQDKPSDEEIIKSQIFPQDCPTN